MTPMKNFLLSGALLLTAPAVLLPFSSTQGLAQTAGGQAVSGGPASPVAALYSTLTMIQKQGGSAPFGQRAQQLAPVVDRAFNLPTVLQTSVGLRYRSLPDAQKQQLEQVFRQFTVARYVSNFAPSTGDTFKVMPNPHPSAYGSDQIVQTQVVSRSGSVTKIDYVMRQFPQGWQAVDVLLDGHISQVAVQRSDFGSAVSTGDATSLIESLKKKIQSFSET